jgi:hypothetical protein
VTQPPADLTAAVFRALYTDYDLRTHGALYVVTPKETPVFISPSLGEIARHLSTPAPGPGLVSAVPPLPARRPGPG